MARDEKGNRKVSYRYIGSKTNATENVGLLLNGIGNFKEKDEVLNVIFTLVFY